jgi:voltage-gated potassium channel
MERLTVWRAVRTIALVVLVLVFAGALLVRLLEPKTFDDFGLSLWWAVETVTTVGYGDIVPVTPQGRIVGTVLMVAGVSMIPLITSIVVSILTAKRARSQNLARAEQIEALSAQIARLEDQLSKR